MSQIPPHIPVPSDTERCQLVDPCRTDKYYYEDESDEDE